MNFTVSKIRNIASVIALGALICLLAGSVFYNVVSNRLRVAAEDDLRNERLRSETFLSEKLAHEKENVRLEEDVNHLTDSIFLLTEKGKQIEERLSDALGSLGKTKNDRERARQLESQLKSSNSARADLEKRLTDLAIEFAATQRLRINLEDSIMKLHASVERLTSLNESLQHRVMDNVLAVSTKRNGKLTVRSRQVKTLALTAEIPGMIDNLTLSIIAPDGTQIVPSSDELNVSSHDVKPSGNAFFSAPHVASDLAQVEAQITYLAQRKLKAGLYHITVINGGSIVGSLQVKLR